MMEIKDLKYKLFHIRVDDVQQIDEDNVEIKFEILELGEQHVITRNMLEDELFGCPLGQAEEEKENK